MQAEGGAQDVEGEVHPLALPAALQAEEQQAAVGPPSHDHAGRGPAGKDAERGRGARLLGIGEDVDAVAQHEGHRRPGRLEGLGERVHALSDPREQLEPVAALAVDEHAPQAEIVPQGMKRLLDEVVGLLPAGALALEPVEQPVQALGNGTRLRSNEILFHLRMVSRMKVRSRGASLASGPRGGRPHVRRLGARERSARSAEARGSQPRE